MYLLLLSVPWLRPGGSLLNCSARLCSAVLCHRLFHQDQVLPFFPLYVSFAPAVLVHDLRETERLLQLYNQAVTAGFLSRSEGDRLNFVALAQHVLSYRPDNPGGLFTQLLRKRHFDYITQDDEDTAQRRLKRALYGGTLPVLGDADDTEQRRAG